MGAIIKKELSSYFNGAIGFIVLAIYYFFAGLFFYICCLSYNTTDMSAVYSNMFVIMLLTIPIITMKSFSEEKKQKTDQALLTSPVSLFEIVFGKFLGALIVFALCTAIYLVFALTLTCFNAPDWSVIICTSLGTILMGAALISIDLFISNLTESQIIAAIVGMALGLFIYFLDSISSLISVSFINTAINAVSFMQHYNNLTIGIISLSDIVFFLSVIAIFLFLTVRSLEKRRWS